VADQGGHRRERTGAARTGLGSVCGSFTPVRSRSPAAARLAFAHVTDGPDQYRQLVEGRRWAADALVRYAWD
jgi:hypothetical protein